MSKLDLTTLGGILFGITMVVMGFILEGGSAGALLELTAAMIVFGGTLGAVAVAFSINEIRRIPHFIKLAFTKSPFDPLGLIDQIISLSETKKRSGGHLALEPFIAQVDDYFLRKGLQLIVDNTKPDDLRQQLERELYAESEDREVGANMFEVAGGFAPTMGIIGTVMGLVHVLGAINEGAAALASAIGAAFIATLYGVLSANMGWLPMSQKLRVQAQHNRLIHEMAMEGLLMINKNDATPLIKDVLRGFVHDAPDSSATRLEAR